MGLLIFCPQGMMNFIRPRSVVANGYAGQAGRMMSASVCG